MLVYDISTGKLWGDTPQGLVFIAQGSSGLLDAANDPLRQGEKGVGPLPAGAYEVGVPYDDPHLGPLVMKLTPLGGTDVRGRDGSTFRVHGFKAGGTPAQASHGCLIFGPEPRKTISKHLLLLAVSSLRSVLDVV